MSDGGYLTVTEVARRLKLHPRTILRFIRDGRLKATQVGRGYRIRSGDLAALEGVTEAPRETRPSATVAVDLGDVDPEGARRWTAALNGAFHARTGDAPRLSLDVVHDPVSRRLKLLMTGEPGDIAGVLGLVQALWEGFSS